jgi:hypothetical protein
MKKFFISAMDESGSDLIACEIEAETFEDALEELRLRAMRHWPVQLWRPTSITEVPERRPISMVLDFTRRRTAA